jgi:ABC-type glycerol-3-phosphate transport system permease component
MSGDVSCREALALTAWMILVSLPVIVLCFVFQRQFVRGILSGSVKA